MAEQIATATFHEFPQYQDVILRVSSRNGSTPVVIVSDGELKSAQDIGQQILDLFNYQVKSDVFNVVKTNA